MEQATKFRLYFSKAQETQVREWEFILRILWNDLVAFNRQYYDHHRRWKYDGKFMFGKELTALLPQLKLVDPRLALPPSNSLVRVVHDYEYALVDALKSRREAKGKGKEKEKGKGKRKGFPKFRSRRNPIGIYLSNQKFRLERQGERTNGKIRLPKLGWVRIRGGKWPIGKINSGSIKSDAKGWYLSVSFDGPVEQYIASVDAVGIDLGLSRLATISDGSGVPDFVAPPRLLRRAEKRLKRIQRRIAASMNGSARRRRKIERLARASLKIQNQRRDHAHNISHKVTKMASTIGLEDLCIQGMQRNHHLAKSLSDAALAELIRQIEYKAGWRDRVIYKHGRFERSTGVCPDCGTVNPRIALGVSEWTCEVCGKLHDRDFAAAEFLRRKALEEVGRGTPEPMQSASTREEFEPLRPPQKRRRKPERRAVNVDLDKAI